MSLVYYYNGSSWITKKPVKRWTGSAWVIANMKRWNGAFWKYCPTAWNQNDVLGLQGPITNEFYIQPYSALYEVYFNGSVIFRYDSQYDLEDYGDWPVFDINRSVDVVNNKITLTINLKETAWYGWMDGYGFDLYVYEYPGPVISRSQIICSP